MWVRLRLDIGWADLARGFSWLLTPGDLPRLREQIEQRWASPGGRALACLSGRSALDLLLSTLKWPAGSEVVFSALNIPHMSAIIRHHGLVPAPADLDPHTLAPDLGALTRAITQRTRAVLIAQLYGSLTPLDAVA